MLSKDIEGPPLLWTHRLSAYTEEARVLSYNSIFDVHTQGSGLCPG